MLLLVFAASFGAAVPEKDLTCLEIARKMTGKHRKKEVRSCLIWKI